MYLPRSLARSLSPAQDNIHPNILKKIKPYIESPNMQIDVVTKVSKAASGLCMFVHAMDVYSKVTVAPAPKPPPALGTPFCTIRTGFVVQLASSASARFIRSLNSSAGFLLD